MCSTHRVLTLSLPRPLWLSPRQVMFVPVNPSCEDYAKKVSRLLAQSPDIAHLPANAKRMAPFKKNGVICGALHLMGYSGMHP